MTTLAIIDPQSLLGDEIKQALSQRKDLWSEVRLLASDPDQVGGVTDFAGDAALVQECDPQALQGVDLAILLHGNPARTPPLPEGTTLLVVDPASDWPDGTLAVAGIDAEEIQRPSSRLFISPGPTVILLAHLLQPLIRFEPSKAVAQVLMPASSQDQAGLDELFEQTRSILAMRDDRPTEVFGKQIAFNLLPIPGDPSLYRDQLERIVGAEPGVALELVQAGVFHSLACNLFVQFATDPGIGKIEKSLSAQPWIELVAEEDLPGPTDAAGREEILVTGLRPSTALPGCYQLWAVMDNLTRGGASNVMEIVASLLAPAS